jgi:dolichol-phosphate mannosyltransferase
VLDELKSVTRLQLVLVDDGSLDTTHAELSRYFGAMEGVQVDIAQHDVNRGLTQALKTAGGVATGEVVCTLDSDCTYDPSEVFGLLELMIRTGADIVTGSPYHPKGGVENVQGWRLTLSRGASRMYGLVLPEKLYCYTSMFRAYRRGWYRPEWLTANSFVGVTEILARAILAGAHVEEYPVVLRRRQYGESKMRVGRAMRDHLRLMGKLAVRG